MPIDHPPVPWPRLKRSLVAILRGVRPDEIEADRRRPRRGGLRGDRSSAEFAGPVRLHRNGGKAGAARRTDRRGNGADAGGCGPAGGGGRAADGQPQHRARNASPAPAAHGMVTMPGVFTATDAFLAIGAGASALKFFPASVLGPAGIAAIRAVLPGTESKSARLAAFRRRISPATPRSACAPSAWGRASTSRARRPGTWPNKARAIVAAYDAAFGR